MKIYLKIAVCCLCLLPLNSYAIKVPGLYEVEVPVQDQTEEKKKLAIKTAMRMVLIKLTGDRFAPQRITMSPVLEAAENYVQQYRYKEEPATTPDAAAEAKLNLWVRFDDKSLAASLRELGVPVWGEERPSTLVWLVVDNGTSRELIGLENGGEFVAAADRRAYSRGIALIFPLLDREDKSRVRASDVWGGFREPVLEASTRYHADSIFIGMINSPGPGIWEGSWTAYLGDQVKTWRTDGNLPEIVFEEGVDGIADLLAQTYAQPGVYAELTQTVITVTDIANVYHYAKVLKYLQSLNSVEAVQVNQVEPDRVTFTLSAHGGTAAVTQAIALGRILAPVASVEGILYRLVQW